MKRSWPRSTHCRQVKRQAKELPLLVPRCGFDGFQRSLVKFCDGWFAVPDRDNYLFGFFGLFATEFILFVPRSDPPLLLLVAGHSGKTNALLGVTDDSDELDAEYNERNILPPSSTGDCRWSNGIGEWRTLMLFGK